MKVFQHSLKYFLILAVALTVAFTVGCKDDEEIDPALLLLGSVTTVEDGATISGSQTGSVLVPAGYTVNLSGTVRFSAGQSFIIQEGVTLVADADSAVATILVIAQGANLVATGTATEPILFTSSNATSQGGPGAASDDWGGIVISGYARSNVGINVDDEYGLTTYGGTRDNDNSGTLQYVSLQFGGQQYSGTSEPNMLSLHAVGSGTTIDHVQAHHGLDDGFEMFGGTVDLKYIVATANEDDQIDTHDGWRGNVQFAIAATTDGYGDNCLEFSNNDDNVTATPVADVFMANVTCIQENANNVVTLKKGVNVDLVNSYFAHVTGTNGLMVFQDAESDITIDNSIIENTGATAVAAITNGDGATFTSNLVDGTDIIESLLGYGGGADTLANLDSNGIDAYVTDNAVAGATGPVNASTYYSDAFFDAGNFIGALENGTTPSTDSNWSWMVFPAD